MPKVAYPASSPYAATSQSAWSLGPYVQRAIPSNSEDRILIVDAKYRHKPMLLASDLYGRPGWWWVFFARNRNIMRDPTWDLVPGIEIIVPSTGYLSRILGD